ncbi:Hypothetical protein FKW44_021639 [Caligus rogercresseyi]|uniref:Uncharacterized protein n=1 Tax=Caligus rogercresseyi TaxID=217165 RepID=A0A7T8GRZ5_CALRO|nr:Hypothetical protein FKW44_021639 [Caligus rogercresseyi]
MTCTLDLHSQPWRPTVAHATGLDQPGKEVPGEAYNDFSRPTRNRGARIW